MHKIFIDPKTATVFQVQNGALMAAPIGADGVVDDSEFELADVTGEFPQAEHDRILALLGDPSKHKLSEATERYLRFFVAYRPGNPALTLRDAENALDSGSPNQTHLDSSGRRDGRDYYRILEEIEGLTEIYGERTPLDKFFSLL